MKRGIDMEMGEGGEVATFLLLYRSIAFTACVQGGLKFPLLHSDYSVF